MDQEIVVSPGLSANERIASELRKNYRLLLLALLPTIEPRAGRLKPAAKRLGLSEEEFEADRALLMKNQLWIERQGTVYTNFAYLDLGELVVSDYMAMTVSILSKLATAKFADHKFETLTLATNRDLVRKFIGKVNQALNSLYQDSMVAGVEKNAIFSWTHTGVIELEVKSRKTNPNEDSDDV